LVEEIERLYVPLERNILIISVLIVKLKTTTLFNFTNSAFHETKAF